MRKNPSGAQWIERARKREAHTEKGRDNEKRTLHIYLSLVIRYRANVLMWIFITHKKNTSTKLANNIILTVRYTDLIIHIIPIYHCYLYSWFSLFLFCAFVVGFEIGISGAQATHHMWQNVSVYFHYFNFNAIAYD